MAHIAYTGGTTGRSKGVMLTHHNVVVNTIQTANWWFGAEIKIEKDIPRLVFPPGINPNQNRVTAMDRETVLVVVPWFHAMGTIAYLNEKVFSGHTMVVHQKFHPKEFLDAILTYKVTVIGGAPPLYFALLKHPDFENYDLSEIKLIDSGAAPLSAKLLDKMLKVFNGVICEGYGLTECTMMATANPPDRSKIRQGSVGIPVFDTECKIIDLKTGEKLPPEKEGEICVKGPQVMQGYWKRTHDTERVVKEDWLFTGDIGRFDQDGYLYISDRKKDVILYKGYNVYPRELEEIIYMHPAVEQCSVVGKTDEAVGEKPVAFIQLKKGANASEKEIMEHTNSEIAFYKIIRQVIFLKSLPTSAAGKILKKKLRQMLYNS